ncbi:PEP-CTERM sorting domain-containing protein [Chroococcidiopsis sp. CCMEE 29]|uniref:PEP-CTERM sorting domain-containing protein n=1 Tax=Chroococcidiopsis sp. CCMEE 29 TaxID=155894 RepID=UPI0020204FD9|nr:PEP-CTERM sorting domain-containing protein [Chroococcidiopsis sp. CCMEE 29]
MTTSELNNMEGGSPLAGGGNPFADGNPLSSVGPADGNNLLRQSPFGSLSEVLGDDLYTIFDGIGSSPNTGTFSSDNPFAGGGNPFAGGENPFAGAGNPVEDGNIPLPFNIGTVNLGEANSNSASSNETIGNGNWHFGSDNTTIGNGNWHFGNDNATLGNGNWYFGNDNATVGNGNWYLGSNNTILGDGNQLSGDDNLIVGSPISNSNQFTSDGNIIIGNEGWLFAANRDAISSDTINELNGALDQILNSGAGTDQLNTEINSLVGQVGQDFVGLLAKDMKFEQAIAQASNNEMTTVAVPEPASTLGMLVVVAVSAAAVLKQKRFSRECKTSMEVIKHGQ